MKAMLLNEPKSPLVLTEVPIRDPVGHELLIKVSICGVCRTDLHIYDGELSHPKLPLILGHQIVGTVVSRGELCKKFSDGARVGVPWLGSTCQTCFYCLKGLENLCDFAEFTGYTLNGGYAEYCLADENYCLSLPFQFSDTQVAPLLCAGLIGFRAYKKLGDVEKIGFYGFGSSAQILAQIATSQFKEIYAFVKEGDEEGKKFAKSKGAIWAGYSGETPPEVLDAAIIFAPDGDLMIEALKHVRKAGIVISAGIHMSEIPAFSYDLLWEERILTSVANLTHQDGEDFFLTVDKIPLHVETTEFPLEQANEALEALRDGTYKGSIILKIN